jgi:hypothetical protein
MIWIGRRLKVVHVARAACLGGPCKDTICVTVLALNCAVRTNKWEFIVNKALRSPKAGAVAALTALRPTGGEMIGRSGAPEVFLMARLTAHINPGEISDLRALVATLARNRRVGPDEREAGAIVSGKLPLRQPIIFTVTRQAISPKPTLMNVLVAALAAALCVNSDGPPVIMATQTLSLFMSSS